MPRRHLPRNTNGPRPPPDGSNLSFGETPPLIKPSVASSPMPTDVVDATLISAHSITPRAKQFLLRTEGHAFDFKPGQHVSVAVDRDDERRVYRPYSPVSQPGTDTIAPAVKRYADGTGSTWMHHRDIGDTIPLAPSSGNLYLRDRGRDAVFLATGTGVTPMLSMVSQYLEGGQGHATLLFGERTRDDLMFRETLDLFSASHPHFTVEYVLSDEDWSGPTGYVQDHLPDYVDDADAPHFYVCGVPEMVVETKGLLYDLGVLDDHIFTEGWEEGAVNG